MNEMVEREQLQYYTEHSVMTKEHLYRQLEETRKRGYSTEIEETELGKACMAAPIMGRSGRVIAGLSVSGFLSTMRLDERQEEIGKILIELANRISMKMGHHAVNHKRVNRSSF
ncbi:MAG: hypothetical protein K0Q59_5816 [Paenibacillus sp.]|nr:hypothetical protein [Paenibacillus sp.]